MNLPIGVFDTGVGGLSVLKALEALLPQESFLYFADTANAPYGNKTPEEIRVLCEKWAPFFADKVKLLVLACHTASVSALATIEKNLSIPVFDIATIAKQSLASLPGKTLLLATKRTIESNFFSTEGLACPRFVTLVEQGQTTQDLYELNPYQDKNFDYVLLGCTHFPFLAEQIQAKLPQATLVDPAKDLALAVRTYLEQHQFSSSYKSPTLYATDINSACFLLEK